MASIVGKKQGGKTYYYLVEPARVEGKPRIVSQQYLGPAEEVTARLAGASPGEPVGTQHKTFGDLAAVWSMLERLDVAGVIDEVVPRRVDAAASVGTYIALAVANRVVAPCSKLAFADWWATTAGPRFTKVGSAAVDHRRFWKAMDRLSAEDLRAIESELGRRIVAEFDLDTSGLVLDMTNFATYIDSTNPKAPIAQRGKATTCLRFFEREGGVGASYTLSAKHRLGCRLGRMEGKINMGARRQVTNKLADAYRTASKADKGRILDEVIDTTGVARSTARRLLSGPRLPAPKDQIDRRHFKARTY